MKKLFFIATLAAVAPVGAMAQDCGWDMYWSNLQQTCLPLVPATADWIQENGQGWWIQPATDDMANYIRGQYVDPNATASQR
ncbi:hypothetical protein [Nioella aestuarii]|uniref:hypothetical protein n=1 Tax=Nioella aestuarii TaxID=1662864 RepID=UPI003D7FB6B4